MSASSPLDDVPGVLGFAIGESDGNLVEDNTRQSNGEPLLFATAVIGRQLAAIGELSGQGTVTSINLSTTGNPWVLAFRERHLLVAECDGARSAAGLESAVRTLDWTARSPADAESPVTSVSTTSAAVAPPKPAAISRPRLSGPDSRRTVPPRPATGARPTASRTAPTVPRPGPPRVPPLPARMESRVDLAPRILELRRALVSGQLRQAEGLSQTLLEDERIRKALADLLPLPRPLLDGIGMVLAGDVLAGLTALEALQASAKSPTLRWLTLIWCARASSDAGAGLDAAQAYAQSATLLASQLDAEASAISRLELATILFHRGGFGDALNAVRTARSLLAESGDPSIKASCWLLEARLLAAHDEHELSLDAARRAREQRPSWPAPATFIARRVLRGGHLDEALGELAPLAQDSLVPTDVERTYRIVELVRNRATTIAAATEYFELADAPPTAESIRKLEELSASYPRIDYFRETLGWQLLRTGHYAEATALFEALGARIDVSEDIRSSVLLALACLASTTKRDAKPQVRIRAAVDAAPRNFRSTKPLPPSSGKLRKAAPIDLRTSDVPPPLHAANTLDAATELPTSSSAGGPVFSGSLQMFSLPDVLEFLRSGQRSGTLLCSSTAGIGAVHMKRGRITGAASPKTKGLGEYLVAMGVVTQAELQRLNEDARRENLLLGSISVSSGAVTRDQVVTALRDQIQDALEELVSWGVGQFAFDPDKVTDGCDADVQIELDPQEVLLNIFKKMDESSIRTS